MISTKFCPYQTSLLQVICKLHKLLIICGFQWSIGSYIGFSEISFYILEPSAGCQGVVQTETWLRLNVQFQIVIYIKIKDGIDGRLVF